MSETVRVQRACLACKHPELLVGLQGHIHERMSARMIALLDPITRRGFWLGTSYEAQALVCPNCGHVESVLKPEELAELQRRLQPPPLP
jgi:uncharacterized protein YbaR (Trm112 family)